MNFPKELKYNREHEWVRIERNRVIIGITDFAQRELGKIVKVELPELGTIVEKDHSVGQITSIHSTIELFTPISGTVLEVNGNLENQPELVNNEPYTQGWMIIVEMSDPYELVHLLSAEAYRKLIPND